MKQIALWGDPMLIRQVQTLSSWLGAAMVASVSFESLCAALQMRSFDAVVLKLKPWNITTAQVCDLIGLREPRPKVIAVVPDPHLMTPEVARHIGAYALLNPPIGGEVLLEALKRALFKAPMSCDDVEPKVGGYYRGSLSVTDSFEVREHLTGCARCRAELVRATFELER